MKFTNTQEFSGKTFELSIYLDDKGKITHITGCLEGYSKQEYNTSLIDVFLSFKTLKQVLYYFGF